jgi:hypothetical protein
MRAMLTVIVFAMQAAPVAPDPNHELKVDLSIDRAFLAANDRDRDGALSLDEYRAAMFARLDAAVAANPAAKAKMTAAIHSKIGELFATSFRSLDKNSDGRFSPAELPHPTTAAVTPPPYTAAEPTRQVKVNFNMDEAFFRRFDADSDGALEAPEFEKAMDAQMEAALASEPKARANLTADKRAKIGEAVGNMFRSLDKNADGKLTPAEVRPAPKPAS